MIEKSASVYRDEILSKCVCCGKCLKNCPIIGYSKFAKSDLKTLQKKRLEFLRTKKFSKDVYESAYLCMDCLACKDSCPKGINPVMINKLLKDELKKCGKKAPLPLRLSVPKNSFNPFKLLSRVMFEETQVEWTYDLPEITQELDVVIFLGCLFPLMPEAVLGTLDIFKKLNISFRAIAGGKLCCGDLDAVAGNPEAGSKRALDLTKALGEFPAKNVVVMCSTCYDRLTSTIEKKALPFSFTHITRFLKNNIKKLEFLKPINRTVTIHDPCHFRKRSDECDAIRDVLRAIPGIKIVEMEHSRRDTLCCGGVAQFTRPGTASRVIDKRVGEAKKTGADIMADMCGVCHLAFCETGQRNSLKVQNAVGLVARSMGVAHKDRLWDNSTVLKRARSMLRRIYQ